MYIKLKMFFLLLVSFVSFLEIKSDEILGCGGFIKSEVPLDFSRVQVKLYTKKGTLKDSTECAPNNGYFFVPLYDKGEYILQVEPPTGWSFDRTQIHLNVDGKTDLCSLGKDINFYFRGFGITGKVLSANSDEGPAGVKISYNENGKYRETVTTTGGHFHFTPVVPGQYTIQASHPKWKFLKNTVTVEVKVGNTELPKDSFIVAGYDVKGKVLANNEPIENVIFLLKSPKLKQIPMGCSVHPVTGTTSNPFKDAVCYVKSDIQGVFEFPSLPSGTYTLVPFYEQNNVKFEIQPNQLEFTVAHDSLEIDTIFQITGITLSGRVQFPTATKDGSAKATILINGQEKAVTDNNGHYTLHNFKFDVYKISAQAPDVTFPEIKIEITPKKYTIPTLIPNAYKCCGQVLSENEYTVAYENQATNKVYTAKSNGSSNGVYCIYLEPGKYEAKVLPNKDDSPSVQFYPLSHVIEITNQIPPNIVFSQLKAVVTGTVQCFTKSECESLQVELRSMTSGSSQSFKETVVDGKYKFSNIPPGRYETSIIDSGYCWEHQRYYVAINSAEASISPFKQTGYRISFRSTFQTQVQYELLSEQNTVVDKGYLNNPPGTNTHCLQTPGRYRFTAIGCHGYEPKTVQWSTSSRSNMAQTPIVFNAVSHSHTIRITSNEKDDKIKMIVRNAENELLYTVEPTRMVPQTTNKIIYEFDLQVASQEMLLIEPKSETLLFKPNILKLFGGSDCVPLAGEITAFKGKLISGRVIPPLAGVVISVIANGQQLLTMETKDDGKFHFGPLQDSVEYIVKAQKDNYFIEGPDVSGNFVAHKMADIFIEAVDQKDQSPLSGVLISVSGGESYRKNLQTGANGMIQFTSLSPGEYFMRPVMKEYRFEPSSKMITVKEGESFHLKIFGRRVAFSAYGTVQSLGGVGEAGALVEARAVPSGGSNTNCEGHVEEATTDINGSFRIRGLLPGCSYYLQLKQQSATTDNSSPPVFTLDNIQGDVDNINLIYLQPPSYTDITVHVYTPKPEDYRLLRVKLGYGDQLTNPIQSVRLDQQIVAQRKVPIPEPGVLVVMNSVPYDNKQYYVQLDSSLSSASHTYDLTPVFFNANSSFKHIYLRFEPKSKVSEYDINQTSMLALPLLILVGLLAYNSDRVSDIGKNLLTKGVANIHNLLNSNGHVSGGGSGGGGGGSGGNRQYSSSAEFTQSDYAEIEQIVQNINATKQKSKKRAMLIN